MSLGNCLSACIKTLPSSANRLGSVFNEVQKGLLDALLVCEDNDIIRDIDRY